jgi:hypothetical protein
MFAYDNDGSSSHGWRLDLKICEVFALTARTLRFDLVADRNRFPQHFKFRFLHFGGVLLLLI